MAEHLLLETSYWIVIRYQIQIIIWINLKDRKYIRYYKYLQYHQMFFQECYKLLTTNKYSNNLSIIL